MYKAGESILGIGLAFGRGGSAVHRVLQLASHLGKQRGNYGAPRMERTPEGWEMQFATNFLGHFALTVGLHKALAAAEGARIVSVSSSGNLIAPVIFDDLHFNFLPYEPFVAYGQSKTACALL
jgi:NAD(P)-dependent dehydrogenase (short-subunit alcohol dehydrogenase family)